MWVCLNDCFLSIVTGPGLRRNELLVRARRRGDIGKLFPSAKVKRTVGRDYLYRAVVRRRQIADALAGEVQRIAYDNFKDSVRDRKLHDAYMRVWSDMLAVQPAKRQASMFNPASPDYAGSFNVRCASGGEPYEVPPHTEPLARLRVERVNLRARLAALEVAMHKIAAGCAGDVPSRYARAVIKQIEDDAEASSQPSPERDLSEEERAVIALHHEDMAVHAYDEWRPRRARQAQGARREDAK